MEKLCRMMAAKKYLGILENNGCRLEVRQDFEAIPAVARVAGRSYQLPTFDISRADHTQNNCFWAFLVQDGEAICSAAALLQDIGKENFADYLIRTARGQYGSLSRAAVTKVRRPLGGKVGGRLTYIGELAVRKEMRGDRRRLACFMRMVQLLAVSEWNSDWSYAFVPQRHVDANLDKLYGFTQRIPHAQTWIEPAPERRSSTEWWVGSPRSELDALFEADAESVDIL